MQLSLDEFRKAHATHIISLGARCGTAYNLRRYYDFGSAYPFDWWIISEQALVGILSRPDPEYFYEASELELTAKLGSVRHRGLDLLLYHEFPRLRGVRGCPVLPNFLERIGDPRRRTAYLLDKLLRLNKAGERIAFIRATLHDDAPPDPRVPDLLNALYPQAEWCLCRISAVPDPARNWKGDPAIWDENLSKLAITLDRSRHRAFQDAGPYHRDADIEPAP